MMTKRKTCRAGFTLLELLVSLGVLLLIVLISTSLYSGALRISRQGASVTDAAAEGQALLELIAGELEQTLTDGAAPLLRVKPASVPYRNLLMRQDRICFAVCESGGAGRDLTEVLFALTLEDDRPVLRRYARKPLRFEALTELAPENADPGSKLSGNVVGFEAVPIAGEGRFEGRIAGVDLMLSVLAREDMVLLEKGLLPAVAFERRVWRFRRRVFFLNAGGIE